MPRRLLVLLSLAVLVIGLRAAPVGAQAVTPPTPYPTLAALDAAEMPPADLIDLARRFRGVTALPEPPAVPPVYTVGERQTFWAAELGAERMFEVEAELRVIGETVYFWVEAGARADQGALEALAAAFDTRIYGPVRELWGSEISPGIDGDPRIHVLFAYQLGRDVAAYFDSRHSFDEVVVPTSNEREMFFVNLSAVFNLGDPFLQNTLAHEFQHMIRANVDPNEDAWMDEGYSMFTEVYLDLVQNTGWAASAFLNAPGTQLNIWNYGTSVLADYGASMLFVTYFYERFGLPALNALSIHPDNGLRGVDAVLAEFGGPDADSLFADWVLANLLQDLRLADGQYGYKSFDGELAAPLVRPVPTLPYSVDATTAQYATRYTQIDLPPGTQALDINLRQPGTVGLIPVEAHSGDWMWYSLRGDVSNPTLTRAFDLSEVSSATLRYRTWYAIEYGWDYAYVSASRDGGLTWEILPATGTTEFDPHGNIYGPGYTGESGGWVEAEVALDAYTGGEVLLRFELVTDEAFNLDGIAIDDVTIPEIGYASDFEADGGGWQAAGWLRIDNVLPQAVWVQAAQVVGGELILDRWLAEGDDAMTVAITPGAERVLLAVSPVAPVTTVPATYTLTLQAR